MEVMTMTRFCKWMNLVGFSSVIVMRQTCVFADHGFSILPNIPNPFNFLGNLVP
jgi:hypothetical protein